VTVLPCYGLFIRERDRFAAHRRARDRKYVAVAAMLLPSSAGCSCCRTLVSVQPDTGVGGRLESELTPVTFVHLQDFGWPPARENQTKSNSDFRWPLTGARARPMGTLGVGSVLPRNVRMPIGEEHWGGASVIALLAASNCCGPVRHPQAGKLGVRRCGGPFSVPAGLAFLGFGTGLAGPGLLECSARSGRASAAPIPDPLASSQSSARY